MRKVLIAVVPLAIALLGIGYVAGQVTGGAAGAAAAGTLTVTNAGSPLVPLETGSGASHADGTVTAISGNTVTVRPDSDTGNPNEYSSVTTIVLTSSTQYNISGGKSGIKVGAHIVAEGTLSSHGKTLTATQVSSGGAGGCPHGASSNTTPGTSTSGTNI